MTPEPPLRTCTDCKLDKPLDCFSKKAKIKDGLSLHCRECASSRAKRYYLSNEDVRAKAKCRSKQSKQELRQWFMDYLSDKSCIDCGESRLPCLDFDHVRGTKLDNVGYLVAKGYALSRVKEEITKCEIRCANCHRMKTATDFGWLKASAKRKKPKINKNRSSLT